MLGLSGFAAVFCRAQTCALLPRRILQDTNARCLGSPGAPLFLNSKSIALWLNVICHINLMLSEFIIGKRVPRANLEKTVSILTSSSWHVIYP